MGTGQLQRSVRIERIIVASLVTGFDLRWKEVRDCVEPEMFQDPFCRDVFERITKLAKQGKPVDAETVWMEGSQTSEDGAELIALTTWDDYTYLAIDYYCNPWNFGKPKRHVTFADYVTQLIRNHDKREQEKEQHAGR